MSKQMIDGHRNDKVGRLWFRHNWVLDPMNTIRVENSKDELLGVIAFDDHWKKWVWLQDEDMQMSTDCLQSIINYCEAL